MVLSNLRTSCVSHHMQSFPSLQLCVVVLSISFAFGMHISVIRSLVASFQYSFDLSESLIVYQLQTLIFYCRCWIRLFLWHFVSQWVVNHIFLIWVWMHPFWDVLVWEGSFNFLDYAMPRMVHLLVCMKCTYKRYGIVYYAGKEILYSLWWWEWFAMATWLDDFRLLFNVFYPRLWMFALLLCSGGEVGVS